MGFQDQARDIVDLTLYMQEEIPWGEGEAIDVFLKDSVDPDQLGRVRNILEARQVSSLVWGRLIDQAEQDGYVALRRFYRE